jgi:hypothetical protein
MIIFRCPIGLALFLQIEAGNLTVRVVKERLTENGRVQMDDWEKLVKVKKRGLLSVDKNVKGGNYFGPSDYYFTDCCPSGGNR